MCGFIVASNIVFDSLAVTGSILATYILVSSIVCIAVYAFVHKGEIPLIASRLFCGVIGLLCVVSVAIGAIVYATNGSVPVLAACVSAAWLLVAAVLLGYGLLLLHRGRVFAPDPFLAAARDTVGMTNLSEDGNLVFSPMLLPVYRQVGTGDNMEYVQDNRAVAYCSGGLLMGVAWGLAFGMVVSPAYWGLIIAVSSTVIAALLVMHAVRRTSHLLDEACALVDAEDARLQHHDKSTAPSGPGTTTLPVIEAAHGSGSLRVLVEEVVEASYVWTGAGGRSGSTGPRTTLSVDEAELVERVPTTLSERLFMKSRGIRHGDIQGSARKITLLPSPVEVECLHGFDAALNDVELTLAGIYHEAGPLQLACSCDTQDPVQASDRESLLGSSGILVKVLEHAITKAGIARAHSSTETGGRTGERELQEHEGVADALAASPGAALVENVRSCVKAIEDLPNDTSADEILLAGEKLLRAAHLCEPVAAAPGQELRAHLVSRIVQAGIVVMRERHRHWRDFLGWASSEQGRAAASAVGILELRLMVLGSR